MNLSEVMWNIGIRVLIFVLQFALACGFAWCILSGSFLWIALAMSFVFNTILQLLKQVMALNVLLVDLETKVSKLENK